MVKKIKHISNQTVTILIKKFLSFLIKAHYFFSYSHEVENLEKIFTNSAYREKSKNSCAITACINITEYLCNEGFYSCFCKALHNRTNTQKIKSHLFRNINRSINHADNFFDIDNLSGSFDKDLSVGVHFHIFYTDIIPELHEILKNIPHPFALYVSTPSEDHSSIKKLQSVPNCTELIIKQVPNRGRDIAPFFVHFRKELLRHDVISHFHTKKSLYTGSVQNGWRRHLYSNLGGSKKRIAAIFEALSSPESGIVYPQTYRDIPCYAHTLLSNKAWCTSILDRLSLPYPENYFSYPVGSMFWARTDALKPLFDLKLEQNDFEIENKQNDGTLAHALERLLGLVPQEMGKKNIIFKCDQGSLFNLEQTQFFKNDYKNFLQDSKSPVLLCDIFDTVLTRPFLNPDEIKDALDIHFQKKRIVKHFAALRRNAESKARKVYNRDVNLDDIYSIFEKISGLNKKTVSLIKNIEIKWETQSISRRPEVVSLLVEAQKRNVPVYFASDMFLPRHIIRAMLSEKGIINPDGIFLSNEINARKDTGEMYKKIKEQITEKQLLMLGDNTHSDVQLSQNSGIKSLYIPSNKDIAFSFPVMRRLIREAKTQNLSYRTALGSIIEEAYPPSAIPFIGKNTLFPNSSQALGKGFMAPLLMSFASWIHKQAKEKELKKILFCARDGKIMYDAYCKIYDNDFNPEYILVSRRAVSVPCFTSLESLKDIATIPFEENTLSLFLKERFGITPPLSDYNKDSNSAQTEKKIRVYGPEDWPRVKKILAPFYPEIQANALKERKAITQYLRKKGAFEDAVGLVDIGYSGTLQKYISQLRGKPLLGLYMITRQKIQQLEKNGNTSLGFLGNKLNPDHPFIRQSFFLEKLCAAMADQVVCHQICDNGKTQPRYRKSNNNDFRALEQLQKDTFLGIEHLQAIKHNFIPEFEVPQELVAKLYSALCSCAESNEISYFDDIPLDDFYAGRGMV